MADLPTLHRDLLVALDELEALTAQPGFDEPRLSSLRYRLSKVSGERRKKVEQLCAELAGHLSGERAARIAELRRSNLEARIVSTAHIGTWTLREIAENWPGYCRASARMRACMRVQIAAEKAVLYPSAFQETVPDALAA